MGSKIELEADDEQQQGDAEVGEFAEHFPASESDGVEQESRGEEADQGRQTDGPRQKAQRERHGDPGDVSQGNGDPIENHDAAGVLGSGERKTDRDPRASAADRGERRIPGSRRKRGVSDRTGTSR